MKQGTMVRLSFSPEILGTVSKVTREAFQVTWRPVVHDGEKGKGRRMRVWYPRSNKLIVEATR